MNLVVLSLACGIPEDITILEVEKIQIKTKFLVVVAFLMCCVWVTRADEDDDTLRFYLAKSPLVISGDIASPVRMTQIKNMTYYSFDLKVREVAKGELSEGRTVHIRIHWAEHYLVEESTYLKEGSSCILFLKPLKIKGPDNSNWQSSALWFGAQPYMLQRLKKLSK